MPELPEVETTRRGIAPHATGQQIQAIHVRESRLRWPVANNLPAILGQQTIHKVRRRAKYLLFDVDAGSLLIHLGMSGSLRIVDSTTPLKKHDHIDIVLASQRIIRFHDPRRFGSVLFSTDPASHPLLSELGPEPLTDEFSGDVLFFASRKRAVAVKNFIMNAHTVVGVGNIYASEALFRAGINPRRRAGRVSRERYARLAAEIKATLQAAIDVGGTTLRDFYGGDGEPGYFRQKLNVYERAGEPCRNCGAPIKRYVLGQRATYACTTCQR